MSEQRLGHIAGERPSRRLAEPVREIDLAADAADLRQEDTWRREGHNARALVKNDDLRIVLVDMNTGARMADHRTDSRVSIHVLTGKVSVGVDGGRRTLTAGHLLALDGCLPHEVEALEPSTLLLTLAREPGGDRSHAAH
jgi:quercetin dioxygenase-like cupin family protein